MKIPIRILRKAKALFIKLKLHKLIEPFSDFLLTLCQLSKLSKWAHETSMPVFNDFYSKEYDYQKRYTLYKHITDIEKLDHIYYLEFGVSQGHSIRWWTENIKNSNSRFVGFDTFTGLPEKWGVFDKGVMTTEGNTPQIDDNRCEFIKGLFQERLPDFLKGFNTTFRKVIHLDADMYTSTLYVLTMLSSHLKKGDILIFDEFNVPLHEFKAYNDFINSFYLKTQVIGSVNNYFQIAFRII